MEGDEKLLDRTELLHTCREIGIEWLRVAQALEVICSAGLLIVNRRRHASHLELVSAVFYMLHKASHTAHEGNTSRSGSAAATNAPRLAKHQSRYWTSCIISGTDLF